MINNYYSIVELIYILYSFFNICIRINKRRVKIIIWIMLFFRDQNDVSKPILISSILIYDSQSNILDLYINVYSIN